jgi:hypothetical protein
VIIAVPCYPDNVVNERSRSEKIAVSTLIVAILAAIAAFAVVPEVRKWIGLDAPTNEGHKSDILRAAPQTPMPTPTPTRTPVINPVSNMTPKADGRWVDLDDNEAYRFLRSGKVEFDRNKPPSVAHLARRMSWYQKGDSVHFENPWLVGKKCDGKIVGDRILGECFSLPLDRKLLWDLRRPSPATNSQSTPRK